MTAPVTEKFTVDLIKILAGTILSNRSMYKMNMWRQPRQLFLLCITIAVPFRTIF